MATKLTNIDRYSATPEQLIGMMRMRQYWTEKYSSFGATGLQIEEYNATGKGLTIRSRRQVAADLPGFARRIVGATTVVNQSEIWKPDRDGWSCELNVEIEHVPGGMSGWMRIEPLGDAESDWSLEYAIKIGVPLVGGKLEGVMKHNTQADLKREFAFNAHWLASH